MKSITLFALAACCSMASFGQLLSTQPSTKLSIVATPLAEDRYDDVDKSPYLFAEFAEALVYDKTKNTTDDYMLNYNGHTKQFEFLHKGKTYELDMANYDEIEIAEYKPSSDYASKYVSESLKFVKGLDPANKRNLQILVHDGGNLTVFKNFDARLSENESTENGKGQVKTEYFAISFQYFAINDGDLSKMRLNKKSVQSTLNNDEVAAYVKKSKLKLNKETELRELLAYYTDVIVPKQAASEPVVSKNNE